MNAFVSEIYSSVQGEGLCAGERQIFLRLAGCPLRCDYCDTPESLTSEGHPLLSVGEVFNKVLEESRISGAKTVSLTGGEPMAQARFLKEILPLLKNGGFQIYLETAGVHADFLREIVGLCDVIAMDIKLPTATGKSFWREHADFLSVGGEKIFVKIVLEEKSALDEFEQALSLLKSVRPIPKLILQPVTPVDDLVKSPSAEQIASFYSRARRELPFVLVMPQQHPLWKIR